MPPEKLKQTTPYLKSSTLPMVDSTGYIQLFGHCKPRESPVKLTEIGTSCGRG